MRYSCLLRFNCNPGVYSLFRPSKSGRATLSVRKVKGGLVLDINAEDAVALRAQLNSAAKLLAVFEAASEAVDKNGTTTKHTRKDKKTSRV